MLFLIRCESLQSFTNKLEKNFEQSSMKLSECEQSYADSVRTSNSNSVHSNRLAKERIDEQIRQIEQDLYKMQTDCQYLKEEEYPRVEIYSKKLSIFTSYTTIALF